MDRDEIRDRFSPLLDGELGPEERAEVEAALAEDAELLRELDALKRVDRLYATLPPVTAPEGFEEGVRSALRPAKLQFGRGRVMRRQMWPLLAAAAVFVVFGAIVVVQMNPERSRMMLSKTMPSVATDVAEEAADPQFRTMADEAAVSTSAQTVRREAQAPTDEEFEDFDYVPGSGAASGGKSGSNSFPARGANRERLSSATPGEGREGAVSATSDEERTASDRAAGLVGLDAAGRQRSEPASQPVPRLAEPTPLAADAMTATIPAEAELTPEQDSGEAQLTASEPAAIAGKSLTIGDSGGALSEKDGASGLSQVPSAPTPIEVKAEDTVKRADRTFHKKAEDWIQDGYKDESLTTIRRGSEEWSQLVKKDSTLRDLLKLEGRIVFKHEDTWHELLPQKPPRS